MAQGEVRGVRGRGQYEPRKPVARIVLGGAVRCAGERGIGNGDPGERGAVDVPQDRREDTKEGVGHGSLPETRRGSWGELARTRRESRRAESNVEVEGRSDALQAALFRKNSRSGRVGTMARAKVFSIARLESEGDTAKGAAVLPRKQTKRAGVRWAAQIAIGGDERGGRPKRSRS